MLLLSALFVAMPSLSQVQPSATGDSGQADNDSRMIMPPLVYLTSYPNMSSTDQRSNFVAGSLAITGAYIDNILPGSTSAPTSDTTISVIPSLSYDRKTPRLLQTFTYNPSLTYYTQTTGLNTFDQSASSRFLWRASPHIDIGFQDFFVKTSNVFNTPYPFFTGGAGGSAQSPAPTVFAPFASQLRNDFNANIAYQFSGRSMVGAGGQFSTYRTLNKEQVSGLYDSDGEGGSAFYNRRISRAQYIGVLYDYDRVQTFLAPNPSVDSLVQALLPFYILSSNRRFSLSIAGGAANVHLTQYPGVDYKAWKPQVNLSFGWLSERGNFAVEYMHSITSGQGLTGSYNTDGCTLSGGWKVARTWTGTASFSYQSTNIVTPLPVQYYPGGTSLAGRLGLMHSIGQFLAIDVGYDRLHQNYLGIAAISANPDSNRIHGTLTYTFSKALGR
jgi:hypothetical protein